MHPYVTRCIPSTDMYSFRCRTLYLNICLTVICHHTPCGERPNMLKFSTKNIYRNRLYIMGVVHRWYSHHEYPTPQRDKWPKKWYTTACHALQLLTHGNISLSICLSLKTTTDLLLVHSNMTGSLFRSLDPTAGHKHLLHKLLIQLNAEFLCSKVFYFQHPTKTLYL